MAAQDKKKNYADLKSWESDGKPFKPISYKPVSRRNDQSKLNRQALQIDKEGDRVLDPVISNPKVVARSAFGNTAPPIPLQDLAEVYEDVRDSSAPSEKEYNAAYIRGVPIAQSQDAEARQKKGAEIDRVNRNKLTDEEIDARRSEYMVLKGQSLELPWWDPLMFPHDGTAIFYGRRRSGKSWMVRHLIHQYKHIYRAVLVLTNTDQNDFWAAHVPFRFIHKYDPFVVGKIIAHQKAVIAHNKLNAENPERLINPYIAVILDDVVSRNMQHDETLNALFYEGRHSKIAVFVTTQHPKALPPGVRNNADLAVIYPQWSEHDMDSIREQYCTFFENKHDFNLMLLENTKDHQCIIIFLGDPTIKNIQSLYVYKADDPGPFAVGSREFWEGDNEERKRRWEAQAALLNNNSAAGNPGTPGGAPSGMHWLVDDTETDSLINASTFY